MTTLTRPTLNSSLTEHPLLLLRWQRAFLHLPVPHELLPHTYRHFSTLPHVPSTARLAAQHPSSLLGWPSAFDVASTHCSPFLSRLRHQATHQLRAILEGGQALD
jgi:hypothetical protein